MRFDVITLFPEMFDGVLNHSILKRAQESGQVEFHLHNLRDYATDKHRTVDDTPYGGGAGMVLRVDVVDAALQAIQQNLAHIAPEKRRVILMCAQGKRLVQATAAQYAHEYDQITLVCGHYEGFDERIRGLADEQLSLGDFVLTGGEIPALAVIDTVTRLLPGVITEGSPEEESFSLMDEEGQLLLEYPHYTRPLEYKGEKVPEILLSGHHAEINKWRLQEAKKRTQSQ
jgi:tRNA (guanine37-N1)-methyltransferase